MNSTLEIIGYVAVLLLSTVGFLVVAWLSWIGASHLAKDKMNQGIKRSYWVEPPEQPSVPNETVKEDVHANG